MSIEIIQLLFSKIIAVLERLMILLSVYLCIDHNFYIDQEND